MLTCLVAQFSSLGWDEISRRMPGRNPRQCRERWKHYLSVGFADRAWTKPEDDLLLEKYEQYGPRWTRLSAFFEKRSDIQIKARWTKLTEKRSGGEERKGAAEHNLLVQVNEPFSQSIFDKFEFDPVDNQEGSAEFLWF